MPGKKGETPKIPPKTLKGMDPDVWNEIRIMALRKGVSVAQMIVILYDSYMEHTTR